MVAERMRNPAYVNEMVKLSMRQAIYPSSWSPSALGSGDLGIALMYSYFDTCFSSESWDRLTQQYLRIAASDTQRSALIMPGLFAGTAGMAFAVSSASRGGRRYGKNLADLHDGLCKQVFETSWRRPEEAGGVSSADFDIVSGAAGTLLYLVSLEQTNDTIEAAIKHLLMYLLWLGEPGQRPGKERWFIPPKLLPNDLHRQDFPQGNFNCGLAHGIPGPLAALALTWLAGYRFPGLRETIAYLSNWVVEHRIEAEWGMDWPASIPLECAARAELWHMLSPTRAAWCYGAPGVARSLWLAGCALEDGALCNMGIEAIEAVLRRLISQRGIPSPNICHGIAGLLLICLRFAYECESTLVKAQIPVLVEQILETFNPVLPLGFRDTDQGVPRDQPAWLTGASGIAMVLLAAATDIPPAWDRILAIA